MSERKTEGKDHKEDDDEEDLEDPDLKVIAREHGTRLQTVESRCSGAIHYVHGRLRVDCVSHQERWFSNNRSCSL